MIVKFSSLLALGPKLIYKLILNQEMVIVAQIEFGAAFQRQTIAPSMVVGGRTVKEALGIVFQDFPELQSYVLDDQGAVRKHVNVFVNGAPIADRIFLGDPIGADDQVYVFQALSGG